MRKLFEIRSVEIPENVEVEIKGREVTVKGPKGTLKRDFSHTPVSIFMEDGSVNVKAEWPRKKEMALVGCVASHIKNMIKGVTQGFTYKMKIVFSHFPISVEVQGKTVLIKNFTGERSVRKAKIVGDATVKVKGEDVIIEGINIEDVAQTAANIQQATRIKRKDPRVFLDGIYVYGKSVGMEA